LRRHLVAAPFELLDELRREQALSRRHDLAELDVCRTEPLESPSEPARQAGARHGAAAPPLQQLPAREREPQQGGCLAESNERREDAAAPQVGPLRLGTGAQLVDAAAPWHAPGLDLPRAVIAESAEGDVGAGSRGHQDGTSGPGGVPQTGAAGRPGSVAA